MEDTTATGLPRLAVDRKVAEEQLRRRIRLGEKISARRLRSEEDLARALADREKWDIYNIDLLTKLFADSRPSTEYRGLLSIDPTWLRVPERIQHFQVITRSLLNRLESMVERLELYSVAEGQHSGSRPAQGRGTGSRRVFVVHGHESGPKTEVARLLEHLGLEAIVLHEQVGGGLTIIENFEKHADVGFAVVLLTPDDFGFAATNTDYPRARARQNVVLELGYFMGRLGRGRVPVLRKGEVEIPSDVLGVRYMEMDEAGAWKAELAREIAAAGIHIDSRRLMDI